MNKSIKAFSVGILLILITSSCEFNNEEELYPKEVIEPVEEVSYSKDIAAIIELSCATSGCHTQGGFANGFFDDYEGLSAKVNNGSIRQRVLVQKDMPPGGSLSDQELAKIKTWLDNGAPNN